LPPGTTHVSPFEVFALYGGVPPVHVTVSCPDVVHVAFATTVTEATRGFGAVMVADECASVHPWVLLNVKEYVAFGAWAMLMVPELLVNVDTP